MRSLLPFLLLLAFIQEGTAQEAPSRERLLQDLEFYIHSIRTLHTDPFNSVSEENFERKADLIRELDTLTYERFLVELMALNALINDEHTMLHPPIQYRLPFIIHDLDDAMVIVATDSTHSTFLLSRVLSMNGSPIEEITARFRRLFKQDNPSYFSLMLDRFFDKPEILIGLGIIDDHADIGIQLLSRDGDTTLVKVSSIHATEIPVYHHAPQVLLLPAHSSNANYWYMTDKENNSIYFHYRRCRQDPEQSFRAFNRELFRHIREEHPQKIIVDLRFNGGGDSSILRPFLRRIRRSPLNKPGRLLVLIGKGTFSSAVMNAVTLARRTEAEFIGKLTGGNINIYGEVEAVRLPHTRMQVTYSTKYFENWKGKQGGLAPEIEVPDQYEDLLNAVDRPYKVAMER